MEIHRVLRYRYDSVLSLLPFLHPFPHSDMVLTGHRPTKTKNTVASNPNPNVVGSILVLTGLAVLVERAEDDACHSLTEIDR